MSKMMMLFNMTMLVGLLIFTLTLAIEAHSAIYCYPNAYNTVCFSDQDGRSFESSDKSVRSPHVIVPGYHPYMPAWMYAPQPNYRPRDREVPEQDFGECTLALGCLKGRR